MRRGNKFPMNKIKQKTYLNISIYLSVVIAVFYIGNSYLIETVKSLSLEVVDKKQKIERLDRQSGQISDIRIGYQYIEEEAEKVSALIISYPDIIDFIVEIENVAEKSKVDLEISVSDKEGEDLNNNLSFVGYSVKATGDFDNLMHFLMRLENFKYLNKVENVRMYYDNKNKVKAGEINLDVSLKVYVKDKDIK